ncbi:MAG: hypothetical protein AB7D33_01430 [Sphingobium sp.]
MRTVPAIATAAMLMVALSACGSRMPLTGKPGAQPVPVARGADRPETPAELMQPEMQSRPDRSAEPLKRSQKREDDPFDLPPR